MGLTKSQIFNLEQNELAGIFRVLANPARIAILQYLSRQQGCICNDIVEEIGLSQPTVSQHLKELKQSGLIIGEVEGKKLCYCINHDKWNEIQQITNLFFNKTQSDCH